MVPSALGIAAQAKPAAASATARPTLAHVKRPRSLASMETSLPMSAGRYGRRTDACKGPWTTSLRHPQARIPERAAARSTQRRRREASSEVVVSSVDLGQELVCQRHPLARVAIRVVPLAQPTVGGRGL